MAEVVLNQNLRERVWLRDEYVTPYIRMSGFDRYMGRGTNAIIRMISESVTNGT